MARMTVFVSSILPCQEAFLVDAPTPEASPHRWIQVEGSGRFAFGLAAVEAALVVGVALGAGSADLGDGGDVEGLVELAVAAAVQSVAHDASAAGFDGSGSVGHGEAGFGPVAAWVAGLGDDLCGCEGADAVDVGEAGAALGDRGGDPRAELADVAVQAPDVGDAVSGDLGSCGGVAAQQP